MDFNFTSTDEEKHSAAHILATAVKRLFPKVKIGIGPVTKDGFYYDFQFEEPIETKDLKRIETTAKKIIEEDLPFGQVILGREEARNMLLHIGQVFKAELINQIPDESVSFYKTGEEFIDLCRGPHVPSTSHVGVIKVSDIEKVHWKDDPERPELTRIHGLVFKNITEYNSYLDAQNQIKKRNFIQVGKSRGVFVPKEGQEKPVLTYRGTVLYKRLKNFSIEKFIQLSPHIIENTGGNPEESLDYNFSGTTRSFRDLPLTLFTEGLQNAKTNKIANINDLYFKTYTRENGAINSLILHIEKLLDITEEISQGLTVDVLCTDLQNSLVTSASNYLQKKIVSHNKVITNLPHDCLLEVRVKTLDSVNKKWDIISLKIIRNEDLKYANEKNERTTVTAVETRIITGNIIGFLLEEKGLNVSIKLHPVLSKVIPINKEYFAYANDVKEYLEQRGIYSEIDDTSKSLKAKLKVAETHHVPFILVVGNKEQMNKAVSLRREGTEVGLISLEDLATTIKNEL